jgi:hypothetical protein
VARGDGTAGPQRPADRAAWRDLRVASLVGGAAVVASTWGPELGVWCPLRRLTGVPCPMCGTTTAAAELLRGDVVGAVLANPVIVAVVATAALAWAMLVVPGPLSRLRAPRPGARWVAAAGGLLWAHQLHRSGHL